MRHNKRYILPKLIGITIIAGVATLIIGTIFKLLLLGSIVAGIGTLITSKLRRREQRNFQAYEKDLPLNFNPKSDYDFAVKPSYRNARKENIAIIPIN